MNKPDIPQTDITIDFANVKDQKIEIPAGGYMQLNFSMYKAGQEYEPEEVKVVGEYRLHGKYHRTGSGTVCLPPVDGNSFIFIVDPHISKKPTFIDCFVICGEDEYPFLIDITEE